MIDQACEKERSNQVGGREVCTKMRGGDELNWGGSRDAEWGHEVIVVDERRRGGKLNWSFIFKLGWMSASSESYHSINSSIQFRIDRPVPFFTSSQPQNYLYYLLLPPLAYQTWAQTRRDPKVRSPHLAVMAPWIPSQATPFPRVILKWVCKMQKIRWWEVINTYRKMFIIGIVIYCTRWVIDCFCKVGQELCLILKSSLTPIRYFVLVRTVASPSQTISNFSLKIPLIHRCSHLSYSSFTTCFPFPTKPRSFTR